MKPEAMDIQIQSDAGGMEIGPAHHYRAQFTGAWGYPVYHEIEGIVTGPRLLINPVSSLGPTLSDDPSRLNGWIRKNLPKVPFGLGVDDTPGEWQIEVMD